MEELEPVRDWDDELDLFLLAWAQQLEGLRPAVLRRVDPYLDQLDPAAPMGHNLLVLAQLRTLLPAELRAAGLEALADQLADRIQQTLALFSQVLGRVLDLPEGEGLALPEDWQAAQHVREVMLSSGIAQAYVEPIAQTLQQHIVARSRVADLRRAVQAKLGEKGLMTRYLTTYATDALYQLSRSYTKAVADRAGARYWYYMGTRIATSRGFCAERTGRVYTQQEVERWAGLTWAGKNPATTRESIFWYVGGYNCRHRLLPISRQLYERLKNQTTN